MRALKSKQMLKMFSFSTNTRIQTDKRRRAQELSAANREARLALVQSLFDAVGAY